MKWTICGPRHVFVLVWAPGQTSAQTWCYTRYRQRCLQFSKPILDTKG
jgi:hypothetical protein